MSGDSSSTRSSGDEKHPHNRHHSHHHHHHSHNPVAAEIPVPHGVQDYEETIDSQWIENEGYKTPNDKDEKAIFSHLFRPNDIYTEDGTYWADLPILKKWKFVSHVDANETKKEWGSLCGMVKEDPLSPVRWYFNNCVIPGAGLGLEGYVLFSIGNVTPLFEAVWPECWKDHTVCSKNWVSSVTYLEIIGIIVGQVLVGFIGDGIGRRFGLIQDAGIMLLGLVMLIAGWGVNLNGWVICYAWSLFIYSIGVGGEYPMTATSGMEKGTSSLRASTAEDRLHRGRKVTQAFLMQGWGQFFNQVLLILLLLIFHHGTGNPPYSKVSTQWTYRIAFAAPALGTLWLVYYRTYKMPGPSKQLQETKRKSKVTGYDVQSLKLTLKHFSPRLIATAGAWFANDVFFYGNKLFQGEFIKVISPENDSVMVGWLWNLVNVGVSLIGYYMASFFIDHKLYGRNRMMQLGFLMDFILFVIPAFHYKYYTSPEHIKEFQAMYFLSSFFNQFGPNAVTFLVAAEVFPTPVRATAHGFAAAAGKLGALLASVLYNYIDTQTKFYVVPWFGLAGMVLTFLFLPDTTGLDLKEQDRRFEYIREGRAEEYCGIAIHPQHLSFWERIRGIGKNYDPESDYKKKVGEMRKEWMEKQREKYMEPDSQNEQQEEEDFSEEVHTYFHKTSPMILPSNNNKTASNDSEKDEKLPPMELPDSARKE